MFIIGLHYLCENLLVSINFSQKGSVNIGYCTCNALHTGLAILISGQSCYTLQSIKTALVTFPTISPYLLYEVTGQNVPGQNVPWLKITNDYGMDNLLIGLVFLASKQTAIDVWRQVNRVASRMIIILISAAGSLIVDHTIRPCFFPSLLVLGWV